MKTQGVVG